MESSRYNWFGKVALVAVAAIAGLYFLWPVIRPLLNEVTSAVIWIVGLLAACAFLYQAYDGIRSAITGSQPEASKAVEDPGALSNRMIGIVWGLLALGIALVLIWSSVS